MRQELFVLTAAAALAASPLFGTSELAAQGRGNGRQSRGGYSTASDRIPPGQMPPAGMCRVWVDGVPPGRQAAPTDCVTARRELRNAPSDARIIYGRGTTGSASRDGRYDRDDDRGREDRDGRYDRDDRDRRTDRRDRDDRDGRYDRGDARDARRGGTGVSRSDLCLDRNHDGICDSNTARNPRDTQTDWPRSPSGTNGGTSNGGGYDRSYPTTLPRLGSAQLVEAGVKSDEMKQWLGTSITKHERRDTDGDGRTDVVRWFDDSGNLVQVWTDTTRDGRADAVEIWQSGRRVRVIR